MRQESSRKDLPLLYSLRLIKSTMHALHHETHEGRNLLYPPDSRQELLFLWSLIDVFLICSIKPLTGVISSTSDKLLSFHISDTSGLERWSRWSGHTSSADLTTFPPSRRNYKFRNLGFRARFWQEQFSRGLPLSPDALTLVFLSCGPSLCSFSGVSHPIITLPIPHTCASQSPL